MRRPSPALWRVVLEVWQSLPAEDRAALAGVEFVEDDTLPPGRLADAGDRLIRLRAGLEQSPYCRALVAHELAHVIEQHDELAAARPHLRDLVEQAADARAAAWGYHVPR